MEWLSIESSSAQVVICQGEPLVPEPEAQGVDTVPVVVKFQEVESERPAAVSVVPTSLKAVAE